MSNAVLTRVWTQSKQIKNHRLLLVALADGVNDQGIGFHGTRFLAEKVLLSERQTKRLRDDLIEAGDVYVQSGDGRGNLTCYLVCTGMEEKDIQSALTDTPFEMNTDDAKNVTLSIVEKRVTFLNERVTKSNEKGDKKRIKGDMVERKSRTTINHKNHKPLVANKSPQAKVPSIPKNRKPQAVDPLFDAIGKCIFDASTPEAIEACNWRIGQILYGDKKRLQTGLVAYEASRQAKEPAQLDYVKLASDVGLFWRNFKKNYPDLDLKDCAKVMEWWIKFRAAQDGTTNQLPSMNEYIPDPDNPNIKITRAQLAARERNKKIIEAEYGKSA